MSSRRGLSRAVLRNELDIEPLSSQPSFVGRMRLIKRRMRSFVTKRFSQDAIARVLRTLLGVDQQVVVAARQRVCHLCESKSFAHVRARTRGQLTDNWQVEVDRLLRFGLVELRVHFALRSIVRLSSQLDTTSLALC